MKIKTERRDVGVIVGRFQVDELHPAHHDLIQGVTANHDRVMVFLGLSPVRVTRNNPLDYEARKQMLLAEYPDLAIHYIKDVPSDELWSKRLDAMISDHTGPDSTVLLYGGRESFISHYHGRYETCEIEQEIFISGTEIRKKVSNKVKASPEFRAGVIWAAYNQYPKAYPTVDVAIWDEKMKRLLMAKKEDEDAWRFVGGFAMGKAAYETEIRREVAEETHIEIADPVYVASCPIDDWRYRREVDGIITILFEAKHMYGNPNPDDDIAYLKWFDASEISENDLVPEHRVLLRTLAERHPEILKSVRNDKEN